MAVNRTTPLAVLYDAALNAIKSIQDGSDYLLGVAAKLRNAAGTIINPSTEDTLATRASETTLSAADTKLGTIDGILDSIKDTDGIKKITDALPAGTNTLGKIDQGVAASVDDAWPIKARGDLSTGNSSATPLAGGATFTGATEEVLHYSMINVAVDSDQATVVDGFRLEFSVDGTNWDHKISLTHLASHPHHVTSAPKARYFRVVFENGATPQTYFRLQTIYHYFPSKPSSKALRSILNDENDAELVRAVISGKKPDGDYINAAFDASGNIKVALAADATIALPKLINMNYEQLDGAIVANQYKRVLSYLVPSGLDGYLIRYSSWQNESAKSRLVSYIEMGTLEFISGTYTPGAAYTSPQWSPIVEAEVTTETSSSGAGTTVTITYTNAAGVGGRTATVFIPKSSVVGTRIRITLQAGDRGVRSVQNITDDSPNAGAIKLIGNIQLAFHNDLSSTIQLETNYQPGAIAFPSGTSIAVEYAGGGVSKDRNFDVLIQLVDEVA